MKLNESVLSSRRAGGMTLVELMIALGIVGFVLLVCYSSSIGLQRGFGYSSAWTEARVSQERVLDSLALDLRNATTIDFTLRPPGHRHIDRPQPLQFVLSKHWGPLGDVQRSCGRPYARGESHPAPQPLIIFGKIAFSRHNQRHVQFFRRWNDDLAQSRMDRRPRRRCYPGRGHFPQWLDYHIHPQFPADHYKRLECHYDYSKNSNKARSSLP